MYSPTDNQGSQAYSAPTGGAGNDLAAALAAADPELLKQALAAGLIDEKQLQAADRLAQARALGGTQMPEGKKIGNVYVAPSPWQNLAAALQQFQGARKGRELEQRQDALTEERIPGRLAGLQTMAGMPFGYGGGY